MVLLRVPISHYLTQILSHNHVKIRISLNYKHVSRIPFTRRLTEAELTHVTTEEERLHLCNTAPMRSSGELQ